MCSYTAIVAWALLLWIVLVKETFISILILQRAIEIWEIILDANKKDTPLFTEKIFVSTNQRYRKMVACLLASRFMLSSISSVTKL